METLVTKNGKFSIGPLVPLHGLEGETLAVSGNHIATVSSAEAIWKIGDTTQKVTLPYVVAKHARWSVGGDKIFVGTGAVDTTDCRWYSFPFLSHIFQSASPGGGCLSVKATAWSSDGSHVAVLLDWSGPRNQGVEPAKIMVFDVRAKNLPITLPISNAEDVLVVGNCVIVASSEVSVWSFSGVEIARLSPTNSLPFRISVSANEDCFALINNDWSVRIVKTGTWQVKFTWKGYFRDIVITGSAFIALDLEGNLHAANFSSNGFELIGKVNIGLPASQLAITDDKRIIIMGVGPISVHSVTYRVN